MGSSWVLLVAMSMQLADKSVRSITLTRSPVDRHTSLPDSSYTDPVDTRKCQRQDFEEVKTQKTVRHTNDSYIINASEWLKDFSFLWIIVPKNVRLFLLTKLTCSSYGSGQTLKQAALGLRQYPTFFCFQNSDIVVLKAKCMERILVNAPLLFYLNSLSQIQST